MANVTMGLDELLSLREEKTRLQDTIKKLDEDVSILKKEKFEMKQDYEKRLEDLNSGMRVLVKKCKKVLPNISDIILKVKVNMVSQGRTFSDNDIASRIADEIVMATTEEETSVSVVNFEDVRLQVEKQFLKEFEQEKTAIQKKNKELDRQINSVRQDVEKVYNDKLESLKTKYSDRIHDLEEQLKEETKEKSDYIEKYNKLSLAFTELSDKKEIKIANLTKTIEEAQEKIRQLKNKKHWWQI